MHTCSSPAQHQGTIAGCGCPARPIVLPYSISTIVTAIVVYFVSCSALTYVNRRRTAAQRDTSTPSTGLQRQHSSQFHTRHGIRTIILFSLIRTLSSLRNLLIQMIVGMILRY